MTHAPFTPTEKRILYITCPTHFFCHFFILVFPAVTMPLARELALPIEKIVRISFLMYLCYGLFALPVGYIVDRWQARGMLIIGQLLMGVGMLAAGLFPEPQTMAVALGVVGVGASVYHPAGLALISRTIGRRGHAMGVNGVFGNLGIACAPLVTGVLTWFVGWQTAVVVLGIVGIVAGISLVPIRVDEAVRPPARPAHGAEPKRLAMYFVILCVALVFGGISYRGNTILLPAFIEIKTSFFATMLESLSFIHTQGTATLAATVLTSIVLFTGIFGQLLGGRLADRMDLRRAYLLYHGLSLPFIVSMAFVSDVALAVSAAGYAFFSLGMQPIENSLIASLTPDRWRSTSFAVKFVLNFGVGASVVYLIEPIKVAYSIEVVYLFLGASTTLLVACAVALVAASRPLASVRN